uniref:UPF0488 protein C8orf33 homolog n=1 Tax=Phallusia mammillata TaxID=59560 RepID=A0A6F9D7K3_9ASCI|nr:UPF0488 protein C8orf33 homolog [Phallusia mammillata]
MSRIQQKRGGNSKSANQNKNHDKESLKESNSPLSTDEQLQKEINWCVEQLRMGVFTLKASEKQVQNSERILKILTSTKAPLVKKRQVMHQTFGDYRKKIQETERKWEKDALKQRGDFKIKTKTATGGQGQFLHVSNSAQGAVKQTAAKQEISHIPNMENKVELQDTQSESLSDNMFRFNFEINS